ncbi:MAG TPA: divergent polysaccharide deacetylase family protein [Thermoanaerobaculia bacterium]|nr:divergent polysaccharide deacetylase family protein [Thermoanaerobaculia bacterium]
MTTRRRKRRSLLVPLLALAACAGLVAVYFWRDRETAPRPSAATEPTPIPLVVERSAARAPARTPRRGSAPGAADFESAAAERRPALALVVDDVGFDLASIQRLGELDGPLALAVIPSAPHAKEAAALAARKKWDLLVHLPMSGADGAPSEADAVGPADDDATIAARVGRAIDAVPGARGLNNHQGSRATADPRVVRAVLEVVGTRGLFFLDSRTSPKTVAEREARRLGIPAVARDVFLDDAATEAAAPGGVADALEKAWKSALSVAARKGSCVLVAHPRKETLDFLAARLASAPARRVKVSELAD